MTEAEKCEFVAGILAELDQEPHRRMITEAEIRQRYPFRYAISWLLAGVHRVTLGRCGARGSMYWYAKYRRVWNTINSDRLTRYQAAKGVIS